MLGEDGGETVVLKAGRFGPYVQRGDGEDGQAGVAAARACRIDSVDLDKAVKLLGLPRGAGHRS